MIPRIALTLILAAGLGSPQMALAQAGEADEKKKKTTIVSEKNTDGKEEKKEEGGIFNTKKKWGIIPFGFPFYTPDTSGAIAFALVFYHNPNPEDPTQKQDEVSVAGTYTLKQQLAVKLDSTVYFQNDLYKLTVSVAGANYPQIFYGIGPNTKDYMKEKYSPVSFDGQPGFLFKACQNLYIGPIGHVSYIETWRKKRWKQLVMDMIPGSDGTMASGFGVNLNFDNRDSTFWPHRGFYVDARALFYRREFGSEYNYTRLEVDFKPYVQLYQDLVLAFQLSAKVNFGTVPFLLMPQLGGMERMRGLPDGRFMDKNCLLLQTEFRFPIVWRIGGVAFGSIGSVAPRLDRIQPRYFKYSYGLGLRGMVDKDEHINIRFDVAFDEKFNPSYYVMLREAF